MRSILFGTAVLAVNLLVGPAFVQSAQASPITDLFSTGVDAAGNALVGGDGLTDSHYTIASSTIGATVGDNAVTYYNPAYVADSATSRWVSNSSDGYPGMGTVTFQTTFDLTGLDPASASISGLWGVDNIGEIFLNGSDTGIGIPFGYPAFQSLHPFSITSGFISGVNILSFEIIDQGPPLAFRVDSISGTANAVPEPGAMLLAVVSLLTLFGFGLMRRRVS